MHNQSESDKPLTQNEKAAIKEKLHLPTSKKDATRTTRSLERIKKIKPATTAIPRSSSSGRILPPANFAVAQLRAKVSAIGEFSDDVIKKGLIWKRAQDDLREL